MKDQISSLEGQQACGQAQHHPNRWTQAQAAKRLHARELWWLQAGFPTNLTSKAAHSEAACVCVGAYCPL